MIMCGQCMHVVNGSILTKCTLFLFSYTVLEHCISCGTERTKRRLSYFSHRAVASSISCGECFSAETIRDEHNVCVC